VIADGENVSDLIPPGVRYLHLEGSPTIGQKRNVGSEAARGELVASYDDDDFSAPGRLADQIHRMRAASVAVTGYRSMRFTDGRSWWLYRGAADYALGTSLVYRRDWWACNPFPEMQVGEDNGFVGRAREQGQIIAADACDLMWATIHDGNTSPRQLTGGNWSQL